MAMTARDFTTKEGAVSKSGKLPVVSVIVLTYNGREHLEECLASLQAQTYLPREIILVINGSEDGSADFVRRRFDHSIRVIELAENIGYTGGNNAGIRSARGEYIALLNDDTRVDSDWLQEMVKALESRPDCAMAAGKILSYYHPEIIDNVGHIFYRDGTFRGRGRLEVDRGQYDREEEVLSPSGCALLFRKKALDEVGLFDEDFFIYGDDAELSLRMRVAGWRARYAPRAVVYHKYSASTGAYSAFKAFLVERNRIWLTIKYFPPGALWMSPFYAGIRLAFQAYGVLRGRGAAGRLARETSPGQLPLVLIRAHIAALAGLGKMWRKRREIDKLRKISRKEFYGWFKRFKLPVRELAWKE